LRGETQFQYDAANRKVVEIPLDTVVKADSIRSGSS
jgi:hypothetical protein